MSVCIWQLAAAFGFMEKHLSRAQPCSTTTCWGRGPSLDQFSLWESELAGRSRRPSGWFRRCGAAWRVLGVPATETSLSPSCPLISKATWAGCGPLLRGDRQMRTQSLALVLTPGVLQGLFPERACRTVVRSQSRGGSCLAQEGGALALGRCRWRPGPGG